MLQQKHTLKAANVILSLSHAACISTILFSRVSTVAGSSCAFFIGVFCEFVNCILGCDVDVGVADRELLRKFLSTDLRSIVLQVILVAYEKFLFYHQLLVRKQLLILVQKTRQCWY
jgi:hypothetical protein